MRIEIALALPIVILLFPIGEALSQELFIYPEEGQSAEQQEKDKFECYSWAKGNSGFDPMAPPTATAPPPQKEAAKGGAARGDRRVRA